MSNWSREELAKFKAEKKSPAPENTKSKRKKKEKLYVIEHRYVGETGSLLYRFYKREWNKYKAYERLQDAERAVETLKKNEHYFSRGNWEYRIVEAE